MPTIADLSVTVDDGKTSVVPGVEYFPQAAGNHFNPYTVTVTNNGPDTVTSFDLNTNLSAGLSVGGFANPSVNGSVGVINSSDFQNFTWSGLSLASGQSAFTTFLIVINPSATGTLTTTFTVSAPAGTTDPTPTNDSFTDGDTVTPQADLAVTMTDGKTTVVPGTFAAYTITVTNNGPSTVSSLTLTDSIPAALLNPNFAPSAGAYISTQVGPNTYTGVWSGLSLASGQSVTLTLTGTIDPNATGLLTNIVTVAPPGGTTDTNSANDTATDTDTTPVADLAVTVTDGTATVVAGTSNAYIITVTNNGPDTVTSLTVTDTIPAALLNPNFAPSAGAYDTNTGVWSGLSLASGQSVTLTLTGTIDPNATGTISNTVTVAPPAGTTDTNSANDTATDNDTLTGPTDLSVTITNAATTLVPGSIDTYTITVANNGANTVSSFDLIDTIPDALLNATFGSPSAGSYDRGSGHWSNLSLANGQSVSITLSGVVGITTGTLATTVTVSAPAGMTDTNLGNNVATDTDTLVLFGSPYPPAPAATSANMLLRRGDGLYAIYNLGNNATLATHPLAQVGTEWQFAGSGRFQAGDTADMLLRNASTGGFQVYDISNNNVTNSAFLGTVGIDWQVMGFGNFSSRGETDMILRNASTGGVEVYDIANNQLTGANFMGTVGLDWQFSGVGNFSGSGTSDLLLRNANTGGLEVYDIANNAITNAASIGAVGLDWQFSGIGNFSGVGGETDLLLRNVNTGGLEVYDVNNNQLTGAAFIGTVGLEWQYAGVAPVRGAGTSDLVLRNVNTGVFEAYNIANNQIIGAASLGRVGLEWQVGGFAADPAPASTSQLVQAMAGFGGGGGAAEGSNTAPLNADASQQGFLTQPHA